MPGWRPPRAIRVVAVGLAWRDGRLLVSEIRDGRGRLIGARPIGGSIEYGETREQALRREFLEELGIGIRVTGPWHAFENLFEYDGVLGHEFVFAAEIALLEPGVYARDEVIYTIENGDSVRAIWASPEDFAARGVALFPAGLADLLLGQR
jgi:8-oxo-dGTP pyrophosphatase MutT (NUDIX family)